MGRWATLAAGDYALWVNLEMVANIGVRETLMLSGTIQPYSQRQTKQKYYN
jgi:hypothetical protein